MAHEIVWTELAGEQYKKVIDYLKSEWSLEIAIAFDETLDKVIDLIDNQPQMGMHSGNYKNIRRILVTKHNILYYEVVENKIILHELFDSRQNPSKNKFD